MYVFKLAYMLMEMNMCTCYKLWGDGRKVWSLEFEYACEDPCVRNITTSSNRAVFSGLNTYPDNANRNHDGDKQKKINNALTKAALEK